MKIQSGSTRPLADGNSDEVFKALLELHSNRNELEGDMFLQHKISKPPKKRPACSRCCQIDKKKKKVVYTLFKAENFTVYRCQT